MQHLLATLRPLLRCPTGLRLRGSRLVGRPAGLPATDLATVGMAAVASLSRATVAAIAAVVAPVAAAAFAVVASAVAWRIVVVAIGGRADRQPCQEASTTEAAKAGHSSASEGLHRPPHQFLELFQASFGASGSKLPSTP